jgi:hypothetical protein
MPRLVSALCFIFLLPMLTSTGGANAEPAKTGPVRTQAIISVASTLDAFHNAAANAELDTYLGLLTTEMVFLGTDASERWQGNAFRDFVSGHFSQGNGWTYLASERHIAMSNDGQTAWFDELLDNAQLGQCRGSGVVILAGGEWRIAQYNLSIPIPNDMARSITADIREMQTAAPITGDAGGPGPEDDVKTVDTVDTEPAVAKKCRKRHKTNTRAGC